MKAIICSRFSLLLYCPLSLYQEIYGREVFPEIPEERNDCTGLSLENFPTGGYQ
jgi:hypothetical protein